MNKKPEEAEIRKRFQRIKLEDELHTPSFDEVLNRPRPTSTPARRKTSQLLIGAIGCAAVIGMVLFAWQWFSNQQTPLPQFQIVDRDTTENKIATQQLEIDQVFDRLNQIVDQHFEQDQNLSSNHLTVWTSATDSILQ